MRETIHYSMNRLLTFIALTLFALAPAQADTTRAQVERFLDGLDTMEASFVQYLLDPSYELMEESEGTLYIQRPGRFRLEYSLPYEQLYVADGKKVWAYDKDLMQITVKPQDDSLGTTPAIFLSGRQAMDENFVVTDVGEKEGGLWWLELRPKRSDDNVEFIRIAMRDGQLYAMEMLDGFGYTTRLIFEGLKRNPAIDSAKFRFSPPPGVDVIGEE